MAYRNKVAEFSADAAAVHLLRVHTEVISLTSSQMTVCELVYFHCRKLRVVLACRTTTLNDTPFTIGHCADGSFLLACLSVTFLSMKTMFAN